MQSDYCILALSRQQKINVGFIVLKQRLRKHGRALRPCQNCKSGFIVRVAVAPVGAYGALLAVIFSLTL